MARRGRKLNPIAGTVKNAGRLKEIVSVFAKHGFANLFEKAKLGQFLTAKVIRKNVEVYSTAERIRMSFEELGPTFVKLGQVLATRPDLIPSDFCEEFEKLHTQVTAQPFDVMESVLVEHFAKPVDQVFKKLDTTPIGAASIAQVYQGTLLSGEEVVVKVQRPGIVDQVLKDLKVVYVLADLLDAYVPEAKPYNPIGIVDEFFKTLELETDFVVEANNMKKFAENFSNQSKIVIPSVYYEYLGSKVLVMQKLEGLPLSNSASLKQQAVNNEELIRLGIECYFQMVFKDGIFHADMHPGNLFILNDGRLGLIDFGVVGRLNPKTKSSITDMLVALATEDYDRLAYEYVNLAPYNDVTDVDRLARELRDLLAPYHGLKLGDVNTGRLLLQTTGVAGSNGLVLPSELVMFFKSIINIEALGKRIKKDFDVLEYSLQFAQELVQTKYNSEAITRQLINMLRDSQGLIQDIPRQARQMMRRWNSPHHKIQLNVKELEGVKGSIKKVGKDIFYGFVVLGLLLGSSIVAAVYPQAPSLPVISIVGYVIAGVLVVISFIK